MSVAFVPHQKGRQAPSPAQIQKMLDENSHLIQAIVDYQNKGKASECLQYQQILHRNLVYLASVADAGPNIQAYLPSFSSQAGGMNQSQGSVPGDQNSGQPYSVQTMPAAGTPPQSMPSQPSINHSGYNTPATGQMPPHAQHMGYPRPMSQQQVPPLQQPPQQTPPQPPPTQQQQPSAQSPMQQHQPQPLQQQMPSQHQQPPQQAVAQMQQMPAQQQPPSHQIKQEFQGPPSNQAPQRSQTPQPPAQQAVPSPQQQPSPQQPPQPHQQYGNQGTQMMQGNQPMGAGQPPQSGGNVNQQNYAQNQQQPSAPQSDKSTWTKEASLALVQSYRTRAELFTNKKFRKKKLWDEISEELTASGFEFTAIQCVGRWKTMMSRYRRTKDHNSNGGTNQKCYEFEEHFDEIFNITSGAVHSPMHIPGSDSSSPVGADVGHCQQQYAEQTAFPPSGLSMQHAFSTSGEGNQQQFQQNAYSPHGTPSQAPQQQQPPAPPAPPPHQQYASGNNSAAPSYQGAQGHQPGTYQNANSPGYTQTSTQSPSANYPSSAPTTQATTQAYTSTTQSQGYMQPAPQASQSPAPQTQSYSSTPPQQSQNYASGGQQYGQNQWYPPGSGYSQSQGYMGQYGQSTPPPSRYPGGYPQYGHYRPAQPQMGHSMPPAPQGQGYNYDQNYPNYQNQ